jgi:hypothetical protein
MATTIERRPRAAGQHRPNRRAPSSGPDRFTVALLALAGFLAVLALLASQLRPGGPAHLSRVVVVRRVYMTRVVETVIGRAGGSSVTQSASSSGSYGPVAAPTTRAS